MSETERTRCLRFDANGRWLGWCGVHHRYEDRARTHVRVLNRSWRSIENPEPWQLCTESDLIDVRRAAHV